MKSKITVNIDSELLDIIRDVSDSDLDSVIQDAIAQFLGVKQVWVKTNTLEPISSVPVSSVPIEDPVKSPMIIANKPETKRGRQPKFVLKIWDNLKGDLGEEFTIEEYWNATKKGGLNYKDSARTSTILEHLKLIEKAGKIVNIGGKPMKYRKSEIEEPSKRQELETEKPSKQQESRPKLFEEEDLQAKTVDKEILV